MKVITYFMNVDWNWIKQRPHFIAERISKLSQLNIVYQYRYGRHNLQKRDSSELKLMPIYVIPKFSGIKYLKEINNNILSIVGKILVKKNKSNIIFATYPTHIEMIPEDYSGNIYYDCMDNHLAFIQDEKERKKLEVQEKKLIEKANKIFVSSEYLKNTISKRYQINQEKIVLVRNAYDGQIIEPQEVSIDQSVIKLAYFGTISSWYDFDTVLDVIQKKDNVEFHLYGPIDKVEIPKNQKIIYHGVIEHDKLYETVKNMDGLIMPFILNDIIEAVDPVKVYEYINFNKNIILREYSEVERLKDFVFFYNDSSEFLDAVLAIETSRTVKYNQDQRLKFLQENTWDKRVEQIREAMGL